MTNNKFKYTDERFADIQMLRYRLDGFNDLTLNQKQLIYCLSQATLWGRDITFDQFGKHNLRIRRTLEAILLNPATDKADENFSKMETYLKRVWFSSGIHHHYGSTKFVAEFSETWFKENVMMLADRQLPLKEGETKEQLCNELANVIFNPSVDKKRVNRNDGDDLVRTSACNYYDGVSQKEAEEYYAAMKKLYENATPANDDVRPAKDCPMSYGLNSQLYRDDKGDIREATWRIGGMYGEEIKQIVYWLERASEFAESIEQKDVICKLIEYYRNGNLYDFDDYSIAWLKATDGIVDFINGFIEVYGDPLGLKGSWEGLVEYKDLEASKRTKLISDNAQWFEDHSPIDPRFKKKEVKGVSASVIRAAMLGGDEYPATAIGINLPNADWIRAQYGSKSITISNITDAYNRAAKGSGFREEYVIDDATRQMLDRYDGICDDLHTDLHECLGHGSGQLLPGVDADALKSYASTIEEARADLFGLYYMADEKMVELGLLPDNEAYKAQYYSYIMNGLLTQMVRIERGHCIEEDHMRNRALIARWCLWQDNTIELVERDGKTYVQINDYAALRQLFAQLLAEIQRIKSEGDLEAARMIVEQFGVCVDPRLHAEVLERYEKLNIAPYKGFLNPQLTLVHNEKGEVVDVAADYSESYTAQMLRYGRDYSCGRISSWKCDDIHEQAKEQAKEIKRSFRLMMNGVASQSMREKGSDYHVNWGASLPMLRDKAKEIGKDYLIARELWKDNVRECKILATMVMPAEYMSRAMAEEMIKETTVLEIAEMLAFNLFRHLSFAPEMALGWIESSEELRQICGYHILSRAVTANDSRFDVARYTVALSHSLAGSSMAIKKAAMASAMRLSEYYPEIESFI